MAHRSNFPNARAQSPAIERVLSLPKRLNISYVEQGEPAGVPVVFLHGTSDSWRSFADLLPHLPATIRAMALSERGHGDSSHPESGFGPRHFAADVAAFLDAKNIDAAVIVGHSMGSTIAQRFAIDFPERTIALLLLGPVYRWRGNAALAELDAAVAELTDPVDPDFAREFQMSTLVQPVPMAFMETAVQESLKLPARVWKAMMREYLDDEFSDRLVEIRVPTLLIWGDQDPLFPRADEDAILAAIPESRLIVYAGTGHAVHWEQPERVAADLIAFVNDNLER